MIRTEIDFSRIETFKELEILLDYLPEASLPKIHDAFTLAAKIHANDLKLSGITWISHILTVAKYLAQLKLDATSIICGLLHDVLEKSDISIDKLDSQFGTDVSFILDGLTDMRKNSKMLQPSNTATLKNLIFNSTEDVRILIIRLAEKIDNILTIDTLDNEIKIKTANKALPMYAPLAEYLGLGIFQRLLEDTAFRIIDVDSYTTISNFFDKYESDNSQNLAYFQNEIKELLYSYNINDFQFDIRRKGYYSSYKKIKKKYLNPNEPLTSDVISNLKDIYAGRIIVDTEETCYITLGLINAKFTISDEDFVDYIAKPKQNGYKSIHTIIQQKDRFLEIQIRTSKMHEYNEFGPASHIAYKLQGSNIQKTSYTWTKNLIQWQDSNDNYRIKAFETSVFVFTPKGMVIRLAKGSTPIDFAFEIHTSIGERYVGAKINSKMVSMDTKLQTGDIVEILTQNKPNVSLDWLRFAKMSYTKMKIRRFLKNNRVEPKLKTK